MPSFERRRLREVPKPMWCSVWLTELVPLRSSRQRRVGAFTGGLSKENAAGRGKIREGVALEPPCDPHFVKAPQGNEGLHASVPSPR